MSTAQGTELVKAAQARGVDVYAETCAQYLVLDDSAFDGPDGHEQSRQRGGEDVEHGSLWGESRAA